MAHVLLILVVYNMLPVCAFKNCYGVLEPCRDITVTEDQFSDVGYTFPVDDKREFDL